MTKRPSGSAKTLRNHRY